MSNSNWARWIFSSLTVYFQNIADENNIYLQIEGLLRKTTDKSKSFELRIDGPTTQELSHNYYKLDVSVNLFWSVDMDNIEFHEFQRVIGILVNAMDNICIVKTDSTHLGTLILQSPARAVTLGRTKEDSPVMQGSVDGDFSMYLDG